MPAWSRFTPLLPAVILLSFLSLSDHIRQTQSNEKRLQDAIVSGLDEICAEYHAYWAPDFGWFSTDKRSELMMGAPPPMSEKAKLHGFVKGGCVFDYYYRDKYEFYKKNYHYGG